MAAKVEQEKIVTIPELCAEANKIWAKCVKVIKTAKPYIISEETADQLLADMRRQHADFAKAYPIVLRYMCQMQRFHINAFKKYLLRVQQNPWKSQEEYLDSQTDYCVLLYKETTPRWNQREVAHIRTQTRKMLQDEHDTFKKYTEEYSKKVEDDEKRFAIDKDGALRRFIEHWGEECSEIPIRCVNDPSIPNDSPEKTILDKIDTDNIDTIIEGISAGEFL